MMVHNRAYADHKACLKNGDRPISLSFVDLDDAFLRDILVPTKVMLDDSWLSREIFKLLLKYPPEKTEEN